LLVPPAVDLYPIVLWLIKISDDLRSNTHDDVDHVCVRAVAVPSFLLPALFITARTLSPFFFSFPLSKTFM